MCVKPQGKQKGVSDQLTADHMSLWALQHPEPYTLLNPRKAQRAVEHTSKAESALSRAKIMASQMSLRSTVRLRNRSSNLHKILNTIFNAKQNIDCQAAQQVLEPAPYTDKNIHYPNKILITKIV
jgi:hypothetical protein